VNRRCTENNLREKSRETLHGELLDPEYKWSCINCQQHQQHETDSQVDVTGVPYWRLIRLLLWRRYICQYSLKSTLPHQHYYHHRHQSSLSSSAAAAAAAAGYGSVLPAKVTGNSSQQWNLMSNVLNRLISPATWHMTRLPVNGSNHIHLDSRILPSLTEHKYRQWSKHIGSFCWVSI